MKHLFSFLAIYLSLCACLSAADVSPAEARLRDSLRATMLQLRTAETERANLQAAQAENDQKLKTLTSQVEALTKQGAADRDASEKTITTLNTRVAEQANEILQLKETLEKWKTNAKQAADVANTKETQRAKLAGDVILLNRRVAEQQTKNQAMYKLGTEILSRYEKFGIGDALTAREPFVGITRVKFENLIQDYSDKLADQKIKPAEH